STSASRRSRRSALPRGGGCDAFGGLFPGEREMAGGDRAAAHGLERRLFLRADRLRLRATRVEAAGRWRVRGARHVSGGDLAPARFGETRGGDRHSREERAGGGVARMV